MNYDGALFDSSPLPEFVTTHTPPHPPLLSPPRALFLFRLQRSDQNDAGGLNTSQPGARDSQYSNYWEESTLSE